MANKYCRGAAHGKIRAAGGFTTVELLIVVVISLVAAAMAIPGYTSITRYLRIAGDIRDLNGLMAEAKMRAAQDYTHARVRANLDTNTYQLEVWDKSGNGGAGCWKTEGDNVNPCTAAASPVQPLSPRVTFGFGGAVAGLPNPQGVIQQAPLCLQGVAGGPALGTIANTACIEFNSRGVPVGAANSPIAIPSALYVTDTDEVYGVTVIATGLMQQWVTNARTPKWEAR
jgi:type II secretory pathway pseudopilin PulG